ncbi:MAG TPA: D-alanine--D-alanine ligase family protein [Candidatus Methylomirabilis sp.]|nr:D-alanine--D-alanine ligase family protein [Candidatus Methylomirabilis sp.]
MKRVALFFGGLGNEAEVSITSAVNIFKNFDHRRYKLICVYWHKDGFFYNVKSPKNLRVSAKNKLLIEDFRRHFDVALLMTHGRFGEDGIIQGILEAQKIKYCGCRVLASALCMDKAVCKELFAGAKIRQTKFLSFDSAINEKKDLAKFISAVKKKLHCPVYVKPSNSGSSVGITKVDKFGRLKKAINLAFAHDQKILIEEGLVGPREIEVAVLGNKKLIISRPGEIKLAKDFYDYDDKYKLGQAQAIIPASLPRVQIAQIRALAEKAYRLCGCSGFARIDFFLYRGKIYLNEINTLPGFTDISMFPLLMMDQGMSYRQLINKIIGLI